MEHGAPFRLTFAIFLTLNTLDTIEIDGAGVLFEMISYTIFILHCSVHYLPSTLDG